MEEFHPLFVAGIWKVKKGKKTLFSAMQVEQGLERDEPTFLVALLELKPDKVVEILDKVAKILNEFKDMMLLELSKQLPS